MQLSHPYYFSSLVSQTHTNSILEIRFPIGSIAIFYAIKSINCERHGHYEQAFIHSRRSLAWSMATFVLALFLYLTIGLIVFIRTVDHRG